MIGPMSRPLTVSLREDLARGLLPLAPGRPRVDREAAVIYGVKVVGRDSPNTHGVRGAEGTDYTPGALQEGLPLYEGLMVNADHPPRKEPGKDRSSYDRIGKLVNALVYAGETYADLHLLKSHPMSDRLMEAAEKMPDAFALSHNAMGEGEVKNGRYVVSRIVSVRSVDVVADGGSNRSLFEGKEPVTTTLRKLIQESQALPKKTRNLLLEMGAACKEDMDRDVEESEEGGPEDWKGHVVNAVGSLVKSEEPEHHDMAAKLMKHLRPADKEETEGGDPMDDGNPDDGPAKKETKEGRERRVKALCRLAGVEATADLVESMAPLGAEQIATVLSELRGGKPAPEQPRRGGSAPRSSSPQRPVQESKAVPATAEEQAAVLLRG